MTRPIAALILLFCGSGIAFADDTARASLGDSQLIAGGEAVLDKPVDGNAFAAGGRVEVRERIEKSAFVSGGDVIVAGSIGRNLFAAGGELSLEGDVEGKARVAGGKLRMSPEARIGGDASFAGGTVEIDGAIGGGLRAYGERIVINGIVGGDVELAGENIRLGPDAHIGGRVAYRSRKGIVVDPAAKVVGGIAKSRKEHEWFRKVGRGATIVGGITVSLGMLLLGGVLVLGMPRFSREAAVSIRRNPWQVLGIGCAMLVGVPFAITILVVTLVGIPLALLLAFSYVALLMLGYLIAAIFVGDQALERVDSARLDSVWWRALFLVLAVIALAFVRQVPVVGGIACFLLFLAGIGAFTMRAWEGFKNDPATASSTGSARRPPQAAG
jgi:cytoskeletal protein CcmA (bactofilin family)